MPRYSSRVPSNKLFRGQERGRLISLILLSLLILGIIDKARDPNTYDFLAKPEVARVHLGPDGLPIDESPRRRSKPKPTSSTGASRLLAQNSDQTANFGTVVPPAATTSADPRTAAVVDKPTVSLTNSDASVGQSDPAAPAQAPKNDSVAAEKPAAEKPAADTAASPTESVKPSEPSFPDDLPPSETSLNDPSVGSKEVIHPALKTTPGTEIDLKDYHPVGPTDEDQDEWDAAKNDDFLGVEDSTKVVGAFDMRTYRRLHSWVSRQTLEQMRARSDKNVHFSQYTQSPEELRGRLVHLDLDIRRCVVHTNGMKQFGVEKYFEFWGFSKNKDRDHDNQLYSVITVYPPEGMPIGADFKERIRFDGYFFKLQGYSSAAKPKATQVAPLFVGRFDVAPKIASEPVENMGDYLWWGVGGMALFCCLVVAGFMLAPRRRGRLLQETSQALGGTEEAVDIDTWLDQAEHGELSADGNKSESDDDSNDEHSVNGQANSGGL